VRILDRIARVGRSRHLDGSVIDAVAEGWIVASEFFEEFDDFGDLPIA